MIVDAHLHRVGAVQRHFHLLFKCDQRRVGPSQRGQISDVGQALRATGVRLAGGANRQRLAIGEGPRLHVATGAGLRAVAGQAPVIK
ncbi:hypothetical protein SDC9_156808 [bioreactor metagenome]|uniref:Uncharacterized protein n=1 Tax=bioreactor metagenome TaxID=1076179 RepID=A0A645F5Q5_9ZZZZ